MWSSVGHQAVIIRRSSIAVISGGHQAVIRRSSAAVRRVIRLSSGGPQVALIRGGAQRLSHLEEPLLAEQRL